MTIPASTPSFSPIIDGQFVLAPWQSYFDSITMSVNNAAPIDNPTFQGTVSLNTLGAASGATITVGSNVAVTGNFTCGGFGCNGHAAQLVQTITGSRGSSGAALNNLLNALQVSGLIINGSAP